MAKKQFFATGKTKMQSKEEFIAEMEVEYKRMVKAQKLAAKLEKQIESIRAQGYKLIVLGNTVRLT